MKLWSFQARGRGRQWPLQWCRLPRNHSRLSRWYHQWYHPTRGSWQLPDSCSGVQGKCALFQGDWCVCMSLPGLQIPCISLGRVVVARRPTFSYTVRAGADPDDVARELRREAEHWARVARRGHRANAVARPQHHCCRHHGDCCRHCLMCLQNYNV